MAKSTTKEWGKDVNCKEHYLSLTSQTFWKLWASRVLGCKCNFSSSRFQILVPVRFFFIFCNRRCSWSYSLLFWGLQIRPSAFKIFPPPFFSGGWKAKKFLHWMNLSTNGYLWVRITSVVVAARRRKTLARYVRKWMRGMPDLEKLEYLPLLVSQKKNCYHC